MEPRRLLQLLLQQDKDHALILLDSQGIVSSWLSGSEEILGYTAEEMVGHHFRKFFRVEDQALGIPEHEIAVATTDGRAENDRWLVRKDGTLIWAHGVTIPLRDPDGSLIGFGKLLRDRTDVKAHMDALENRAEFLAAAERRRSVSLGTLAHELRNPLASVLNAAEVIGLTKPQDPNVLAALKIIERQVGLMGQLIDDLLDAARAETGKVELRPEVLELKDVVHEVAESMRGRAERRNHTFHVLLMAGPVVVNGDPDRLQQVLVNLLDNAMKYTPPGGQVWLKVSVEGDEAVVRVQDTGVGIGSETLPKIFDLFTQEETARTLSPGGLGLGLALVRELVTLHGGTVQVRSEGRNKGSEFTVRLPLHKAEETRTAAAFSPEAGSATTTLRVTPAGQ